MKLKMLNIVYFQKDNIFIDRLASKANGLILFSGPTGSGKSTSMYKLASRCAQLGKQVLTIEDPVEKNINNLIQMQINEKSRDNLRKML